jgi:hypothetical protein
MVNRTDEQPKKTLKQQIVARMLAAAERAKDASEKAKNLSAKHAFAELELEALNLALHAEVAHKDDNDGDGVWK